MINFKTVITVVTLFLVSIFIASPVQAATLTFEEQPSYAGLTFTTPLEFHSWPSRIRNRTLQFGKVEKAIPVIIASNKTILAPTATPMPTSTPFPTSVPTISPISTPVAATPLPVQATQTNAGGLDAEKLFSMSNAYRASKGLAPLQKDERACQLAASRAPEINEEIVNGHMHSGLRNRNLSYWNRENIISMRSENEAFTWWVNDQIHREAIEGNFTYSCVACSGNACAQEFTNFQAK